MNTFFIAFQTLPAAYWITSFCLIGLCIGSFLNVVIYRTANHCQLLDSNNTPLPFWTARSCCPHCRETLAWYDNIPLLSFVYLKGRCRTCHDPISWQYPLIEALSLALTLIICLRFGLSAKTFGAALIAWWLIPLAVFDFNYFLLPNRLTLSLMALGLALNSMAIFCTFSDALIGIAAGYGSLALIDTLYYLCRKHHGIGQGDWKLFAALGACFGWPNLLAILLLASLSATLIGLSLLALKRTTLSSPLPFGVFLSFAGIIVLLADMPWLIL